MARPMVTVEINEKQMRNYTQTLGDMSRKLPVVLVRSLNRTIKKAKVDTSRAIGREVRLKQGDIKKGIQIRKASKGRLVAIMKLSKKRYGLIKFAARQLKKGVSYAIKRSGGRRRLRTAFRQTMPVRGHKGVFRRKRPSTPRLPIMELRGPSIAGVFQGGIMNRLFGTSKMARQIKKLIRRNLAKNIDGQIKSILRKRGM